MASDVHEPLLGRYNDDEHGARQDGSIVRTGGAAEEGGQGALTTRGAEPGEWGMFMQSLVATCVQRCRALIGAFRV